MSYRKKKNVIRLYSYAQAQFRRHFWGTNLFFRYTSLTISSYFFWGGEGDYDWLCNGHPRIALMSVRLLFSVKKKCRTITQSTKYFLGIRSQRLTKGFTESYIITLNYIHRTFVRFFIIKKIFVYDTLLCSDEHEARGNT